MPTQDNNWSIIRIQLIYLIFLMVYKMLLDEYIFRNQSLPYKYL